MSPAYETLHRLALRSNMDTFRKIIAGICAVLFIISGVIAEDGDPENELIAKGQIQELKNKFPLLPDAA